MDWKEFKAQGCLMMLLIFVGAILLMVAIKVFIL
jgi:hypothetical protein